MTQRFSIALVCSNVSCGEKVVMLGNRESEEFWGHESVTYTETYLPKAIFPAPPIIDVPPDVPRPIKEAIEKSFELYWVSSGSCANMLRVSVEFILDFAGVPSEKERQIGKSDRLTLFQRIDLYKADQPQYAKVFDALRLVGNIGSHNGVVSDESILDAYELLEDALAELYAGRTMRLGAMLERLIAHKGSIAE